MYSAVYIHIYIPPQKKYIHTCIHTYIHTLHYITLHYITLHYIALHCITLHYITLHYVHTYITYMYIYIHSNIEVLYINEYIIHMRHMRFNDIQIQHQSPQPGAASEAWPTWPWPPPPGRRPGGSMGKPMETWRERSTSTTKNGNFKGQYMSNRCRTSSIFS